MMTEMILICPLDKFLLASWTNYEKEWTEGFDTVLERENIYLCVLLLTL